MLWRRAWPALLAAAVALILTGCRLTVSYEFSVRPDGLVDVGLTILADRELIQMVRMSSVHTLEELKAIDLKKEAEEMVADINKDLGGEAESPGKGHRDKRHRVRTGLREVVAQRNQRPVRMGYL